MSRPFDITPEDWARYRGLIKDIDMSDEQKDEVIAIVDQILRVFVHQAFELDPVQLSLMSKAKLISQFEAASASVSPSKDNQMSDDNPANIASDFEDLSP